MNALKTLILTQIFMPKLEKAPRTGVWLAWIVGFTAATAWGISGGVVFWGEKSKAAAKNEEKEAWLTENLRYTLLTARSTEGKACVENMAR